MLHSFFRVVADCVNRRIFVLHLACTSLVIVLAGCTYEQATSPQPVKEAQTGLASFYGREFQGEQTASGETFDQRKLIAAHPSYPLGTMVRVTNLEKEGAVEVRIADRGPTQENRAEGVIIDLSQAAAERLAMVKDGRTRVRVEVLEWGEGQQK